MSKSLRIGDMANPGSETTADIDSIATSATNEILPLPVVMSIVFRLAINEQVVCHKKIHLGKLYIPKWIIVVCC